MTKLTYRPGLTRRAFSRAEVCMLIWPSLAQSAGPNHDDLRHFWRNRSPSHD